jgi:hypothetical protein
MDKAIKEVTEDICKLVDVDGSNHRVLDSLEYIRTCVKYLLFDNEASQRELKRLKERLETE